MSRSFPTGLLKANQAGMKLFPLTVLLLVSLNSSAGLSARFPPQDSTIYLDITEQLDKNTKSGKKMLVWECCKGVKLYAKLSFSRITKKTTASYWSVEDENGGALRSADLKKTTTVNVKGVNARIRESIVLVPSRNIGFVIKREILK